MTTYMIVGARFRPPAQAILNSITPETSLYLRAEPSNEYDPNAIQVFIKTQDIPEFCHERLVQELEGTGKYLEDIQAQAEWHLGYIPKEIAALLRANLLVETEREYLGEFLFNYDNKPMIRIDLE